MHTERGKQSPAHPRGTQRRMRTAHSALSRPGAPPTVNPVRRARTHALLRPAPPQLLPGQYPGPLVVVFVIWSDTWSPGCCECWEWKSCTRGYAVADPGGGGGRGPCPPPPWPVKNSHKKDVHHTRWPIFHVSWPPPRPKFLDPLLLRSDDQSTSFTLIQSCWAILGQFILIIQKSMTSNGFPYFHPRVLIY